MVLATEVRWLCPALWYHLAAAPAPHLELLQSCWCSRARRGALVLGFTGDRSQHRCDPQGDSCRIPWEIHQRTLMITVCFPGTNGRVSRELPIALCRAPQRGASLTVASAEGNQNGLEHETSAQPPQPPARPPLSRHAVLSCPADTSSPSQLQGRQEFHPLPHHCGAFALSIR